MADEKPSQPSLHWGRTADFDEKYANNVSFESSGWDLKLVFGTLDQGTPDPKTYSPTIKCHTSIAMPWRQAKLMAYAACMNVLWHERTEGRISVGAAPPSVEVLVNEIAKQPGGEKLVELDKMLRAVFGFDEQAK